MLKIITRPLYPILPTNAFDWCAYAVTRTTVHVHYGTDGHQALWKLVQSLESQRISWVTLLHAKGEIL